MLSNRESFREMKFDFYANDIYVEIKFVKLNIRFKALHLAMNSNILIF